MCAPAERSVRVTLVGLRLGTGLGLSRLGFACLSGGRPGPEGKVENDLDKLVERLVRDMQLVHTHEEASRVQGLGAIVKICPGYSNNTQGYAKNEQGLL